MTRKDRITAALIGAYVADAAALGFHWLYDPPRIAALAGEDPAFRQPDPADFEGVPGIFVHHGKRAGDLSHYGAQMRVMTRSLAGGWDLTRYQDGFAAMFGPGGEWRGYADKATKGTLANLAADRRDPSGADDDQVPAIAKLPPLLAVTTDAGDIDAAVAATNANDTAAAYARNAAAMLIAAYDGADVAGALEAAIAAGGPAVEALRNARDTGEDLIPFATATGIACPLPQALPLMVYIAARSASYREAVTMNIAIGGDNCGRAPVLGALFGAVHGLGGNGAPGDWILRLNDGPALAAEIRAL